LTAGVQVRGVLGDWRQALEQAIGMALIWRMNWLEPLGYSSWRVFIRRAKSGISVISIIGVSGVSQSISKTRHASEASKMKSSNPAKFGPRKC